MATLEEIQAQFPYLAYLINDAEVGPLLQRALDPNQPYSSDRFQAELMNTNWWRTRSEQTRQLESQRNVDPGTYWNTVNAYGDELGMLAGNLGLSLNPDERYMLSVWGNNAGVAPDSASMMNQLRGLMLRNPHTALGGGGAAGAAKVQIEELIRGQWFAPIADMNWLGTEAIKMATGAESLESINAKLATQAWHKYEHLRPRIAAGETLADIFNPYRQAIAEELEYGSVEQVDMNNDTWRGMLWWGHPSEGKARMPTEGEIRQYARNRPEWWKTNNGRAADSAAATSLLQMFGQRA